LSAETSRAVFILFNTNAEIKNFFNEEKPGFLSSLIIYLKTSVSQEIVANLICKLVASEHIVWSQIHHKVQVTLLLKSAEQIFLGSVQQRQSSIDR